ncbi:ABA DEFICIENT chloroplastic-like isoform X3 [Chlorella sorokiniana]|uniref:ABA DEFICIENT chloroplastic-like isoform X3 n=1 Tax=Chlorella sorokiniana TaxID=3076 RepID=A0A2P6U3F7_CHLSO|nr:ABA DEFICIENT chloroplastic-like isoform X3 [Chlorella sorokiniana]|eukprot:PRW60847.1 ABA DEFICIENT chloroplastic-like isoform X3 [Chlorella sorokiniana]
MLHNQPGTTSRLPGPAALLPPLCRRCRIAAAPARRTAVVPQAARGGAAAAKVAAAAAAAAAAQQQTLVSQLFAASTVYALAVAGLMVLAPRWDGTRRLLRSPLVLAPLALVYGLLLAWSWQPDTFSLILPGSWAEGFKGGFNPQFMPSLSGICTLFSRWLTAASLWVHLLAVNLFAAREMYLEGQLQGVPTWHSILLCMTLAPLGLLSHALTKAAWRRA